MPVSDRIARLAGPLGLAAALLALTALVGGCAGGGSAACEGAGDCESDQLCQSQQCVDLCDSDNDCSTDRICNSGICEQPARCAENTDCRTDEICVARQCVTQEPECSTARDCPPRQVCEQGVCDFPDGDVGLECFVPGDCFDGQSCVNNVCVGADVGPDADDAGDDVVADPDTTNVDTSDVADTNPPDVLDAAPDALLDPQPDPQPDPDVVDEAECGRASDCADDEECIRGMCEPIDECNGNEPGRYGQECGAAAECCNGLCLGNELTGAGFCTQDCASYADCNPVGVADEYFCTNIPGSGDLCAASDFGTTCGSADDCLGGRCLIANAERACTYDCDFGSDCAPGSACGGVGFNVGGTETILLVCSPIGSHCLSSNDCLTGTCLEDDTNPDLNYCSVFCNTDDPTACPSPYSCQIIDPDFPGVCIR